MAARQPLKAVTAFARALILNPQTPKYYGIFSQSVAARALLKFEPAIKDAIFLCLNNKNLPHLPLFFVWHSMLNLDPALKSFSRLNEITSYKEFSRTFSLQDLAGLLNSAYLTRGLKRMIVKNYELERTLLYLRRYLLCAASNQERKAVLPFLFGLSTQCFLNEYIWHISEEETGLLEALIRQQDRLEPCEILLISCYRPLYRLKAVDSIKARLSRASEQGYTELAQMQITTPQKEQLLKKEIPQFGEISNDVSKIVQDQYEQNPFPRWLTCAQWHPGPMRKRLSRNKKILIAGCGTGQQVVLEAQHYPESQMVAIDLSLDSLAYAKRKADEHGLDVAFKQGDILQIDRLDDQFDYISCGGVLHHMKSPQAGLESLRNALKPAGIMKIALYSEYGRRDIVKVQNWIKEKGYRATEEDMRRFRHDYIKGGYKEIFSSKETPPFFDCFSFSDCRDLFFNVQEHRFTCLKLQDLFAQTDLDLLAFALSNPRAQNLYRQIYPQDKEALDLKKWDKIEQKSPHLFFGMYKFCVGHKGCYSPGTLPDWLDKTGF